MHLSFTTWLLALLTLLLKVHADQHFAEDCRVYCLNCGNFTNYSTPNVMMQGPVTVSLQVTANGSIPIAHILVRDSNSSIKSVTIQVYRENVTLLGDEGDQVLTLISPRPAAPWVSLVLHPVQDSLLVYTPGDNRSVINVTTTHGPGSLLSVSTNINETYVVFNCLLETQTNTEEAEASPPSAEGEEGMEAGGVESSKSNQTTEAGGTENKQKDEEGGAGAGQVTTWVMAGLALFLVMVLAFAFCTKTARASQAHHVHDSQPSVGIIYCKGAAREPDEDSEPESPNELKVPDIRNSYIQRIKDFKTVED